MHHYQPFGETDTARILERNSRWRDTRSGVVDEMAQALSFGALHRHQAHMTPDMIAIAENRQISFIAVGVLFQTLDALLD
jgi:hypothetical protein